MLVIGAAILFLRPLPRLQPIDVAVGLLFGAGALAASMSSSIQTVLAGFHFTYMPMLYYVAARLVIRRPSVARLFLISMVIALVVVAAMGLFLMLLIPQSVMVAQLQEWGMTRFVRFRLVRAGSTVIHPVEWGGLSAMGATMALCLWFRERHRWFYGLSTILLAGMTILSISGGAWLQLLFSGGIGLLLRRRSLTAAVVLIMAVLGLASVVTLAIGTQTIRIADVQVHLPEVINRHVLPEWDPADRQRIWSLAWELATARPWGYGLGEAGAAARRVYPLADLPPGAGVTDGWYWKATVEGGVQFLAVFLLTMVVTIRTALSMAAQSRQPAATFGCIIASVLPGALLYSFLSNVWDFHALATGLWLLIGLATPAGQGEETGSP
jgi:hypothetical protein